jgi:hypothetical protein
MNIWPKDDTANKNTFYGNFHDKFWANDYLIHINPPFQMFYEKKPIPSLLVNKKCADAMMAAFTEIWDKCGYDQEAVDKTGASDFGGCFNIRAIAGSNNWSNHSWACAIDLSPSTNGFNMVGTISNIVVDAFKRQGFRWGGDYVHRKDKMHFEAISPA